MSSKPCRRRWSAEEKRLIMDETRVPGTSVAAVARRHDVNANLLFKWLRQAGQGRGWSGKPAFFDDAPSEFVALGVVSGDAEMDGAVFRGPAAEPSLPSAPVSFPTAPKLEERAGTIEIDLADGARVRVDGFVNQRALRRVLQAMKDVS
ncbi:MAG: IS66-like element accessory protein TnpA [Geminicoccaceae bacterium]